MADLPFSSRLKYMARVVKSETAGVESESTLIAKGAPDILLTKCTSYLDEGGVARSIDSDRIQRIVDMQNEWCSRGERVLAVCTRERVAEAEWLVQGATMVETQVRELCFVGLVAMVDAPREHTAEAVYKLRRAGIRVVMITGDFAQTAKAIAAQVGIFDETRGLRCDSVHEVRAKKVTEYACFLLFSIRGFLKIE